MKYFLSFALILSAFIVQESKAQLNNSISGVNAIKLEIERPENDITGAFVVEPTSKYKATIKIYRQDPNQNYATVLAAKIPVIVEVNSIGLQAGAILMQTSMKGFHNFKGKRIVDLLGDFKGLTVEAAIFPGMLVQVLGNRSEVILANVDGLLAIKAGVSIPNITIKMEDKIAPALLNTEIN